jgi:hypothetical protein
VTPDKLLYLLWKVFLILGIFFVVSLEEMQPFIPEAIESPPRECKFLCARQDDLAPAQEYHEDQLDQPERRRSSFHWKEFFDAICKEGYLSCC